MNTFATATEHLDWHNITTQLDQEGFAVLPGFLKPDILGALADVRKSSSNQVQIDLSEQQSGRGSAYRWKDELPAALRSLREAFYAPLALIANRWCETLAQPYRYPETLQQFQMQCFEAGQRSELTELTCLRTEDYLGLQQDADGERVFPLQLVGLLSSCREGFTGGELVLTEQRPRMQSRPMVVPLQQGDLAIITTAQRPFKGSKGYYRVNMKHAISRVRSGERIGISISFHFAP
ncbi:2OG-Fe(II) oxygenase [Pseudomonas sp. SLFW]|uniref:2OG-Fe(II) oxygenase n=1 Tax=Pseudomonas sp. SLFW TaxID=2683259 RepID=UPI001411B91D|nr:2OG-Fe(II) oxygenase [Pseudomonas sp. SLFW]NBB09841.1 prolyl 4-hydroxylase [Pseudomonas sp. SLFW]